MPCNTLEIKGYDLKRGRGADRDDAYIRHSWLKRFESEGIQGLETRAGRGRKPIMDCWDEEAVRAAIEKDRQSVKKAKETWQQAFGKEANESTFRVFLSALVRDIDV